MRLIRSLIPIAFGLLIAVAVPFHIRADDRAEAAAARYIRTLFDATLPERGDLSDHCRDIEAFGRFAAGRLWHAMPDPERAEFNRDFCAFATDAVNRLRSTFPGLKLEITHFHAAPQNMISVHSVVVISNSQQWPVDWLVAGSPTRPHLADMRLLGISLGILLRGLAAVEWPEKAPESLTSAEILRPWRRALDRALPPPSR